ncbi:MAG: PAS domain S-box protein [Verrucomicrobiota bacterium]
MQESSVMIRESVLTQNEEVRWDKKDEIRRELSYFLSAVPACIYMRDLMKEGRSFRFLSQSVINILGYQSQDFLSRTEFWWERIHKEDRQEMVKEFDGLVDGDEVVLEYRFCQPDGSIRWIRDSFSVIDKEGQLQACGYLEDISESRKNEQSLGEALAEAEQFRLLFQISADMVCVTDFEGRFRVINPAWEGAMGFEVAEFMRTPLLEFIHPDDVVSTEKAFASLRAPEQYLIGFENRFRCQDGSYRWLAWNASQYRDSGMIYSVVRDITKRKQAIEALEESERNYMALAEASPVGIFRATCEGEWFYVNQRCCELTGCSIESLKGINWRLAVHPDDIDDLDCSWKMANEAQMSFMHEFRFVHRNGNITWVYGQAATERDAEGNVTGYVGTITDITERRQMAEEHEKLSRLESLGVLAGGIAHDFNNILSPILGNLSLAKSLVETDDDIYDCLDESERASIKARDLTQQLLTFAKGGAPIKRVADLKTLVEESAIFALHGANVTADFQFDDNLMAANIDQAQIGQVIQNLVINAVQSMSQGGVIKIRAKNETQVNHPHLPSLEGNYVSISVEDKGSGIDPRDLDRIYDPYFTTKSRGHGLGLATTLSIVQKHDGYLGAKSELEVGTTFTIYLPALADVCVVHNPEHVAPVRGTAKILVMDDEKSVRTVMTRLLKRLGYDVGVAPEGGIALQMYKEASENSDPYDLVIMDLTIRAGMGGEKAIELLRTYDPHALAIVFSGYSDNPVMADYEHYGFNAAIQKPFTIQAMSRSIESVLMLKRI